MKPNPDYKEFLSIKVKYLGKGIYGCRLYRNDRLIQTKNGCTKSEIGDVCREMLRWQNKGGSLSKYAHASRHRHLRKQIAQST